MCDVILFPRPKTAEKARQPRKAQAMTLFIHVRRATMIAHIADQQALAARRGNRVRKS